MIIQVSLMGSFTVYIVITIFFSPTAQRQSWHQGKEADLRRQRGDAEVLH